MAYITLNEAKDHLVIDKDWTDDDNYINGLIDMVETVIENHIHDTFENLISELGAVPKPVIHAMKIMISHFYEVREPIVTGTITAVVPYSMEYLLDPYVNRTIQ